MGTAPRKFVEMMDAVDLVARVLLDNIVVEALVAVCQIVQVVNAEMTVVVVLLAVSALPHRLVPTVFVLGRLRLNVPTDNVETIGREEVVEVVPLANDAEPDNVNVFMTVKRGIVAQQFNSQAPIPDCVLPPLVDLALQGLLAEIMGDVLPCNNAPFQSQLLNVQQDVLCLSQLQL